ncbi:hypothetical protein COLO4_36655 [Corchorus olitorius]|uniref:Uncharacterized protein n=1 Tax=Corchorus olitorius TaxID=93759 RepID=A0A1R3G6Z8_9ROSI|nr:hypothetical protein COLO4_36655 [Corchorus olitorius]
MDLNLIPFPQAHISLLHVCCHESLKLFSPVLFALSCCIAAVSTSFSSMLLYLVCFLLFAWRSTCHRSMVLMSRAWGHTFGQLCSFLLLCKGLDFQEAKGGTMMAPDLGQCKILWSVDL